MSDDPDAGKSEDVTEEKVRLVEGLLSRKDGAGWQEVNIALQQIMQDYAGAMRSQPQLEAGLFHLGRLKRKALEIMRAGNQHEAGRCLEVLNLIDLGELVFLGALDRKETRGNHIRSDYPLLNPRFNKKVHIVKQVDGKPVVEWRDASRVASRVAPAAGRENENVRSWSKEVVMPPVIDRDKCIRCGKCVDTCTEDVFFESKKKQFPQVTYPEECVYCNGCVEECPVEGAIHLRIPLPMMLLYKP